MPNPELHPARRTLRRPSRIVAVTTAMTLSFAGLVAGATVSAAPSAQAAGCSTADAAQGKRSQASSAERGDLDAPKAFDGDPGTRWASARTDAEWVWVDLGTKQAICGVDLVWEAAYASGYRIQVSDDGTTWTPAHETTTGKGGTETIALNASGRYVRMLGTKRATTYGYSLFTMRVHVTDGAVTPTPTPSPTPTPTPSPTPTPTPTTLPTSDVPDFGPNVTIFSPTSTDVQAKLDAAFNSQLLSQTAQFGDQRHTFLFKPGSYNAYANLGFYTTIAGLGLNPDDVTITRNINVDSGWNYDDPNNATQNFWRSAENLSVDPEGVEDLTRFAVSQAAPIRRVHFKGNLTFGPSNQDYGRGYSSGGYLADSKVGKQVTSGSQQQFYLRNSTLGSWSGGNWNMVFSGVAGAPPADVSHTVLPTTPVTREKPYLYLQGDGTYDVFVPSLARNSTGITWPNTPGTSVPLSKFYVAKPGDSAARINSALAQGLNLFFTPGTYQLDAPIEVKRAGTIVYGLGFPTLVPTTGKAAMTVADADGIKVSGLLFDAGSVNSPTLLSVGQAGVHVDHAADPTVVQDVYFRVGGPRAGKNTTSLVVHSDDTVVDHTWIWRADHGVGVGWTVNTADTGIIVNGDDVLATGLFVEHYQKYQTIWNGERGRTIFYQNEMPYDPPSEAAWTSPTGPGYAAYKVADTVKTHEVWGGGAYAFFQTNPSIRAARGFEVPRTAGVKLHNSLTVSLGDVGGITNVVNDVGGPVPNPAGNTRPSYVPEYP